MDHQDTCPTLPEDRDNFLDQDGCPDPDNDLDGVQDVQDAAANAPEDWDGFEDTDGVLDADNDRDGIADSVDRCPNQAGAGDGCPGTPMVWVEQSTVSAVFPSLYTSASSSIRRTDFLYQRHCSIEQGWRVSDGPSQHIHPNAASILRIEISTHVHASGSKYDQWLSAQRVGRTGRLGKCRHRSCPSLPTCLRT